ncbi:MAG: polyamine aminopropyltransferase, partial [bacterium]
MGKETAPVEWITDPGGEGFAHIYRVDRLLYDGRSNFQRIRVIENRDFGRMLILDDAVQTTERDDFIYHELLSHVPLCTHPAPGRLLIIGGGDGGLLREALRHPLAHATMVEIDGDVIDVTRRLIPTIPGEAFDDPRTRLLVDDGIRFVRDCPEGFDVALVDSTDPKGPSVGLFASEFYADLARLLGPSGVLAVQSGSPIYQRDVIEMVARGMAPHFRWVRRYLGTVPTYPGVLWSFTIGSQDRDPVSVDEAELSRRMRGIATRYYTPA